MMNKPNVDLDHLVHEMAWRSSDKLCPLPLMSGNPPVHCLGYGCAWWNPHYGGCCIGTNYLTLDHIGNRIHRVGDEIMRLSENQKEN